MRNLIAGLLLGIGAIGFGAWSAETKAETTGLPSFLTVGACVMVDPGGPGAYKVKIEAIDGHWIRGGATHDGGSISWLNENGWINVDASWAIAIIKCPTLR